MFLTTPGRTCPTWISERTFLRDSRRDSSIKSRRETTIFFRSKLIFNIRNSYVLPTCSSGLRIGVTSNCEPGKNASTPTSTIKPPLTALRIIPSTMLPSVHSFTTYSQALCCSARFLLITITPSSSSNRSRYTSTS